MKRMIHFGAALGAVLVIALSVQAAPITVARVGGYGNNAADAAFSSGDLAGSITNVSAASFNATSVAGLLASYDVLLFGWTGSDYSSSNLDWATRIQPYVAGGGGVIFEQPQNLYDLGPGVTGDRIFRRGLTVAAVPGLTDGITGYSDGNFLGFSAWDPALTPFLWSGGTVTGLYGSIGSGRIVLQGPATDYHGWRGASPHSGNQYNLLLNELRWVSSGERPAVPEPSTFALLGIGIVCIGFVGVRRRDKNNAA